MEELGRVSAYLLSLGFSPKHKGYLYLREAINICSALKVSGNLSIDVYPAIAQKYRTNVAAVEKNISNAVGLAWLKGDIERLDAEFGSTIDTAKGKPTAKQFIYGALENLKQQNL